MNFKHEQLAEPIISQFEIHVFPVHVAKQWRVMVEFYNEVKMDPRPTSSRIFNP